MGRQANKTNLFIVGFPKCGTTALYEYLSTHPAVHPSFPKEPHYFIEPHWHRHPAKSLDEYLNLFSGADSNKKVFLDSSALHIYSSAALKKMYQFNSDAKIIVMLRNPIDMVVSFQQYSHRTFVETDSDFNQAWAKQNDRAEGKNLPPNCQYPIRLQYKNIGSMGKHVQELYKIWPSQQIKLVFMEDFIKDPLSQYHEILKFIGIDYDGRIDFPPVNEGGSWKSPVIGRLMMKYWPLAIHIIIKLKLSNFFRKPQFLLYLWGKNSAQEEKIKISDEQRQILISVFRDDILQLAELSGKNLDHWLL